MHATSVAVIGDHPHQYSSAEAGAGAPCSVSLPTTSGRAAILPPRNRPAANSPYLTAARAAELHRVLGISLPPRRPMGKRGLVLLRKALRGLS